MFSCEAWRIKRINLLSLEEKPGFLGAGSRGEGMGVNTRI
ncbi:hypothetical protein S1OALGB6SA_1510, partial [Olavius algarvensis spirochete endosymbiont]